MSVSESIAIDVNIPPKAAGGGWKQSVDPRKLGTALSVGDTQTASALLTSAGTDIDSDILFWDYVADPADGLPACTCVHYAAAKGNVSVVAWLAGQGAHPGLKDALGRTPMDVACSDEVREELQRALGAYTAVKRNLTSTSSPGKEGRSPSTKNAPAPPPRMASRGRGSALGETKTASEEGAAIDVPPIALSLPLSSRASELLREVERVKGERKGRAPEDPALVRANMLALEQTLQAQLSTLAVRQAHLGDSSAQLSLAEAALRRLELELESLEVEKKRVSDAQPVGSSPSSADIIHRANEALAALDCRAAIIEAQAMLDPPSVIKALLVGCYAVIRDAPVPHGGVSGGQSDDGWAACRHFLRSDEFLDAMYQASGGCLAARPSVLSSLRPHLSTSGVTRDSVLRACAPFEPLLAWLLTHISAGEDLLAVGASNGSNNGNGQPVSTSSVSPTPPEAGDPRVRACVESIAKQRTVVTAASSARREASDTFHSGLSTCRSLLMEIVRLRATCGMPLTGLWDGGEELSSVCPQGMESLPTFPRSGGAESPYARRVLDGASDSKFGSPRSPTGTARRRSIGESPTRPASREVSPFARNRRSSLDGGKFGKEGKEIEDDVILRERWPDESLVSGVARRRNSTHSNSPLRRSSVSTSALPPVISLPLSTSSPVPTTATRRASIQNPSFDSPQIRRLRVSSIDAVDPDLAVPKPSRTQRSGSGDSSSLSTDTSPPPGDPLPSTTASDVSPIIAAVRRSSVVKVASPLRRKSSLGSGLIDAAAAAVAGLSVDASTDPSLQRVRRMSIEVPQDAVEGVALSNRVPMSVPMSAPEHVRSTSVSPHGSGSQFPALRKSLSAQAMPSSVPPVVEVAVAVTEGYGTPVSAAAVAMRRNSVVQRPSPLRRVSAVEPAMAAAVQKAPQGSPPNVTPEPNSSSAPPAAVFLSPGNSAFRRCLSGSVSPSHHDGITGTNSAMGATDRSSATPPNLSPSAPAETAVAAPAPSATVMDGILATLRASDMESRSPGVKLVPGRTPVRVSRVEAMNMEMVNTPSAEHRSGGEPSSTQSSGRRLSARPTSARRLADALAFADLAESRGLFESTGTA